MCLKSKMILLLGAITVLSVFGYNLWLYSCGSCTLHSLMTPSAPGYLLLGLNLGLGLVLLWLRKRHDRQLRQRTCQCGSQLLLSWHFCPRCGVRREE